MGKEKGIYKIICDRSYKMTLHKVGKNYCLDIRTKGAVLGHSKIMTSLLYSHTDKEKKRGRLTALFRLNSKKRIGVRNKKL